MGRKDPDEAVNDLIDAWEAGQGGGRSKAEYLGMDEVEYAAFAKDGTLPPFYEPPEYDEPAVEGLGSSLDVAGCLGVLLLVGIALGLFAVLAAYLGGRIE